MADTETRETWQARLWAANDEGIYRPAMRIITAEDDDHDGVTYRRQLAMRELFAGIVYGDPDDSGANQDRAQGLLGDILGLWLDRVDWYAVVASFTDE